MAKSTVIKINTKLIQYLKNSNQPTMTHKLAACFVSEVLLEAATLGNCMLHHWGLGKKPCC